jgi:hypothetical protein
VSEHLHRVRRGVRGGVEPPAQGFGGSAPEFFFFFRDDIFSGRHISGTRYFRDDILPGRHISGTT